MIAIFRNEAIFEYCVLNLCVEEIVFNWERTSAVSLALQDLLQMKIVLKVVVICITFNFNKSKYSSSSE
ncbi:hypothetical protein RclHR1_22920002 [Rhizophagus clarus]|uniref:Uncharacterized protein n=1 Tax=Rhizophagus clarus TaxID=94130 RepID=A0A2Z6QZQ4_9GLOM|nr:hypothetical protein RclHR1_22920002 [Rhizophagus clarus]